MATSLFPDDHQEPHPSLTAGAEPLKRCQLRRQDTLRVAGAPAEQYAVLVHLGREPGRRSHRVEEAHDGRRIGLAPAAAALYSAAASRCGEPSAAAPAVSSMASPSPSTRLALTSSSEIAAGPERNSFGPL